MPTAAKCADCGRPDRFLGDYTPGAYCQERGGRDCLRTQLAAARADAVRLTPSYIQKVDAISAFLEEIEAVCERHSISIGHEDGHGRFLILDYDDPRGSFGEGTYYDKRKKAR